MAWDGMGKIWGFRDLKSRDLGIFGFGICRHKNRKSRNFYPEKIPKSRHFYPRKIPKSRDLGSRKNPIQFSPIPAKVSFISLSIQPSQSFL